MEKQEIPTDNGTLLDTPNQLRTVPQQNSNPNNKWRTSRYYLLNNPLLGSLQQVTTVLYFLPFLAPFIVLSLSSVRRFVAPEILANSRICICNASLYFPLSFYVYLSVFLFVIYSPASFNFRKPDVPSSDTDLRIKMIVYRRAGAFVQGKWINEIATNHLYRCKYREKGPFYLFSFLEGCGNNF